MVDKIQLNKIIKELEGIENSQALQINIPRKRRRVSDEKITVYFYSSTLDKICAYRIEDIKKKDYDKIIVFNNYEELDDDLIYSKAYVYNVSNILKVHPYCALDDYRIFAKTKRYYSDVMLIRYAGLYLNYPYMEQLMKAGFAAIINDFLKHSCDFDVFEKTFKAGNNIQQITSLSNSIWKQLVKHVNDYEVWIEFKNLIDKHDIKSDLLNRIIHNTCRDTGYSIGVLDIEEILEKRNEFNIDNYYTLSSLMDYVDKAKLTQGLKGIKVLAIIRDYLNMCAELEIVPAIKSENLERDHDVVSVIYNRHREEIARKKAETKNKALKLAFLKRHEELKKYSYEDENLKVIIPGCANDLFEEGKNNHNCVASYTDAHAEGTTDIFFIRRKDTIDKSYITVEVNEKNRSIKQAFYAGNRTINKKEDLDFIDRWVKEKISA